MTITANIQNSANQNLVSVQTNGAIKEITIPPKSVGQGSSVNGGEFLFLSLATCFCNDLYREAGKRSITIESVGVQVRGEFGKEGEPATNITYQVDVKSSAPSSLIKDLIAHVDTVAEIHNTLRQGVTVILEHS
jgi:uncharacterized OsmC-like protein